MFVGCVVAGVVIGLFIDVRLASSPVGVVAGTALGIVVAGVGFWLRVRSFLRG
jgi:F0F1-type ATP synthase assembly protein I